jgi:glycosyltransferase involved in cell wall biosynthesis
LNSLRGNYELEIVAVEGDSQDETAPILDDWASKDKRVHVIHRDLGYPDYGSQVHPERFKALAAVSNLGLEYINDRLNVDYILWLESDLIIANDMLERLLARNKPAISPMIWVFDEPETRFYDIWAYRWKGGSFPPHTPAWYWDNYPQEPFEIDTAGSVILLDAKAIKDGARFTQEEAIVSFCKQFKERGYQLWCDPTVYVRHPWPR